MRRAAKVDLNHAEVQAGLESIGASFLSLAPLGKGAPDALVAWNRRLYLLEIKNPDQDSAHRKLTKMEAEFHERWKGPIHVVHNLREALQAIGAIER